MNKLSLYLKSAIISILFFSPLVVAASVSKTYELLYNPLPSEGLICPTAACDLTQMFLIIIRDILQLVPIAAVLAIIIGGFQMISSSGNEERLLRAKRTVLWAVLGFIATILSFSIIAIIKNLLNSNV